MTRIYKISLHGKVLGHYSFNQYISKDCAKEILIEEGFSSFIHVEEVK